MKNVFLTLMLSTLYLHAFSENCRGTINPNRPQYIVGYGSLINKVSKTSTVNDAGKSFPVIITGYKRGWYLNPCKIRNEKNHFVGYYASFLDVVASPGSHFNAIIYRVKNAQEVKRYDKREYTYCRASIQPEQIRYLAKKPRANAQIWMYVQPKTQTHTPTAQCPIVQSYVDLYLTGCMNIGKKFHLNNFTQECITTTHAWSKHWVNDRIYPRRPFIYQPNARHIDKLLHQLLPTKFNAIRLER